MGFNVEQITSTANIAYQRRNITESNIYIKIHDKKRRQLTSAAKMLTSEEILLK